MKNVVERLLNLLAFLLTAGHPVSAAEIRRTVAGYGDQSDAAFRRMFERDKDMLRGLGIPLEMHATDGWEVEYGYVVPSADYSMPDPDLDDEERAALWLAAQVVRLGAQPSGPEAILKLGGAPLAGAGEPLAADLGMEAGHLELVFRSVVEHRTLAFQYRDRRRVLHPYGMVHQRGHWYVVGEIPDTGIRAFRIDRAEGFLLGAESGAFDRPAGFRASEQLSRVPWEAGDDVVRAAVRFDSEVAWWARRQLPKGADIHKEESGAITAHLDVAHPEAFIGWMLAFDDQAEVLEPAALRERVIDRVRQHS